ncbi:hypothetical protein [Porphyromonas somerae]|uniref:hypothetical protein n=1 Tax=Porphyromonas somerae TaxID=322095 RepID=UPI001FCB7CB1|nr:hypothetical protein [Porphyromonas somerae]
MKRKGFSNVVVKVGARASALIALSLAIPMAVALSSCDREEPNCPKKTVEEPKGIEVLIDYEDVATGETTRSLSNGRSLGRLGEGFDVEADGLRLYGITYDKSDNPLPISPELTFYAKENVVFQGWSWRYGTDKPGTQRDSKGNIINDYIATPALQPDAGQHKLALSADKTSFTCKYDPNTDNKVYVKVRYVNVPSDFPRKPYCPALYLFDVDKTLGTLGIGVGDKNAVNGQMQASNLFLDLLNACEEYLTNEYRGSLASAPQSTYDFLSEFQRNVPTIDQDLLEIRDGYYRQLLTYRPRSPYVGYDKMAFAKIEELQFLSPYLRTESNFRHETVEFLTRVQNSLSKSGSRGSFNVGTHRVDRAKFAQLVAVYMNEIIDMESRLTNILKGNGIGRNDDFDYDVVTP